jgi:hypothetical protein
LVNPWRGQRKVEVRPAPTGWEALAIEVFGTAKNGFKQRIEELLRAIPSHPRKILATLYNLDELGLSEADIVRKFSISADALVAEKTGALHELRAEEAHRSKRVAQ